MPNDSMQELIDRLPAQWESILEHRTDPTPYIIQLLETVYEIGIAMGDSQDAKLSMEETFKATSPLAEEALEYVGSYVSNQVWRTDVSWEHEDWETWQNLCYLRSQLAFLYEMYSKYIDIATFEVTDIESLNKKLDENAGSGYLPKKYIPNGIPINHYWWWLPNTPSQV